MKTLLTIITASLCLWTAQGDPIEYRWTATGSGTLDTKSFTDALFTITAIEDTDYIDFDEKTGIWSLEEVVVTVFVTGVGSAELLQYSTVFGRETPSGVYRVGFYQSFMGGGDGFAIENPTLEAYDPRTSIGPVSGPFVSYETNPTFDIHHDDATHGEYGRLQFYGDSISTVTFEAKLIPEPSTFALLGLGSLAVMMVRRQPRKGQRPGGRGGSLHGPSHSPLVSGGHQHPPRRLILFQRPRVDELSRPLLPRGGRAVNGVGPGN